MNEENSMILKENKNWEIANENKIKANIKAFENEEENNKKKIRN